jgi:hypothetical protein
MPESPLQQAIQRLPIPVLWERLGPPGRVRAHCTIRSPLRDDDRTGSFSIFAGRTRWKDHGNGQGGDSFDLFQAVKKMDAKSAWRPFLELAGVLQRRTVARR